MGKAEQPGSSWAEFPAWGGACRAASPHSPLLPKMDKPKLCFGDLSSPRPAVEQTWGLWGSCQARGARREHPQGHSGRDCPSPSVQNELWPCTAPVWAAQWLLGGFVSLRHSQDVPEASLGTGTLCAAQGSSVTPQVPLTVTCQGAHGPAGLAGVRGAHPRVPPMPPGVWGCSATGWCRSPARSCQWIEETRPQQTARRENAAD